VNLPPPPPPPRSCVGVEDVLKFESKRTVAELQHEDMRDFGRLILMLACRNANACEAANIRASVESARRMYSSPAGQRLIELIAHLLNEDASVYSACHIAAEFLLDELDQSCVHCFVLFCVRVARRIVARRTAHTVVDRWSARADRGRAA